MEGSWYKEFGEVVKFPSGVRPEAVDDGRLASWPAIAYSTFVAMAGSWAGAVSNVVRICKQNRCQLYLLRNLVTLDAILQLRSDMSIFLCY